MAIIYPKNQINYTIEKIISNASSSLEDILKLEAYFVKHEREEHEKEKLKELVDLKKKLKEIGEIKYYKTPNN
jgi:hypothetical protein